MIQDCWKCSGLGGWFVAIPPKRQFGFCTKEEAVSVADFEKKWVVCYQCDGDGRIAGGR